VAEWPGLQSAIAPVLPSHVPLTHRRATHAQRARDLGLVQLASVEEPRRHEPARLALGRPPARRPLVVHPPLLLDFTGPVQQEA